MPPWLLNVNLVMLRFQYWIRALLLCYFLSYLSAREGKRTFDGSKGKQTRRCSRRQRISCRVRKMYCKNEGKLDWDIKCLHYRNHVYQKFGFESIDIISKQPDDSQIFRLPLSTSLKRGLRARARTTDVSRWNDDASKSTRWFVACKTFPPSKSILAWSNSYIRPFTPWTARRYDFRFRGRTSRRIFAQLLKRHLRWIGEMQSQMDEKALRLTLLESNQGHLRLCMHPCLETNLCIVYSRTNTVLVSLDL